MKLTRKISGFILVIIITANTFGAGVSASTPQLSSNNLEITEGKAATLTVSGYSGEIKWWSSDRNVAAVTKEGKVGGIGVGTAVIYAQCGNVTLSCRVTVFTNKIISEKTSVTIETGERATINFSISSIEDITFRAQDKSVVSSTYNARTNTLNITGLTPGKTQVRVFSRSNGKLYRDISVTVKPAVAVVTSIGISMSRTQYQVGESGALSISIFPENAADKSYTITSSSPAVLSVTQSGSFTCHSSGEATITVTATNGVNSSRNVTVISLEEFAVEVIRLTNIERANNGLSPLSGNNAILNSSAMIRAEEAVSIFSHTRPNGSSWSTVLDDAGLRSSAIAENISQGRATPEATVAGWMNSAGHRKNILHPDFNNIGVGVAMGSNGRLYWVQLFSR